ncbi:type IX secretion system membrane protein, PorP/SprF family [Maribacter dokdonensis]|uniref:Type IX secretion system membrane protein, PorP/SprF family n=1 Tax=Maribacter dokdonensis TaxID=320912 RepID=A0ABY0V053_9FLAO|nr:PorP/SprF family type IX secretion system membrane protein [Maribacter dokdonensis]SDT45479.1 type IX secretion system membrane protein, PorP/SprF family [Maribacter dokdonensis]
MQNIYKNIALMALISFALLNYSSAQQTPTFSEYNYNPYLVNSAFAGLAPSAEIGISNTGTFNQIEGSPKSFALSFHTPLNRGKIGLGAGLIRDEIGVTTSTSAFATYSYKIFFDTKKNRPYWQIYTPNSLSFSISPGVQQYQDNLLELGIMDDPNFAMNINATVPTIGLGFLLNLADVYVGFSTPNVIGDMLVSDDNVEINVPYYGYLGYRFFSNKFEELMIKPNLLLKYENGAPFQIDMNIAVSFKNRFELGTGYRSNSSINLLAGVYLFKNIRAIYSYNVATNNSTLGNTHGIIATYRFGQGFSRD